MSPTTGFPCYDDLHYLESSITLLELRCISWLNLQLMNLVESHYRISMLWWSTLLGKQYNITGVEVYILTQFTTYEFSWVTLQDFHVTMFTPCGKQYNITGVEVYILTQFTTYEFSWVPLQDFHVTMIYTTWKAV